ncbi:MAG TPA: methylenetetrahydrofolate reductase C-terminal domain-containing protein [Candidatus Hydrogenedentes bacterium]|nr:methylenetetrahydrofolate reductase C-terminal domain-containing protein [Candidatus Hydrogenedentota bacterium]HRT20606.1 methylenetetrahydrofolate reductase C-terminal domain-containing protein [Candidatus Hydrogenedentota bacterium]HRT65387.1 methylenetetrahydrofolate reductase C-terminal domain-containing protein [Candidatus Hydrogenedentota bacterium]
MNFLARLLTRTENFAKGVLFDCHHCGQCVLSHTGYTQCPMACPRQVRNGPCGGSMDEHCEVFPDRPCVWARIHQLTDKNGTSTPPLLRSPDPKLFFTSSYMNYFTGKDLLARTPIPYLDLGTNRKQQPPQTASRLERKLRAGQFVFTSEIRSPRGAEPEKVQKQAELLRDHFDALNATAYLNGKPSMPSAIASAQIVKCGVEPICQSVCRDLTKTAFISELITNKMNGVHNSLCITGDYYQGDPGVKQVYDMDSALMIYEARYLREKGVIFFTGDTMKDPPKPFIAGAINPFTTPWNVPIRRLKQKVAAGVDFIQTQVILDLATFREFMRRVHEEGIDNDVFILAGLPVIISKKAFEMMPGVPGIRVPKHITERFAQTQDIVQEGVALAREMIAEVRAIPGVSGVHLMLFGLDHKVLPAVVEGLREKPAVELTAAECGS